MEVVTLSMGFPERRRRLIQYELRASCSEIHSSSPGPRPRPLSSWSSSEVNSTWTSSDSTWAFVSAKSDIKGCTRFEKGRKLPKSVRFGKLEGGRDILPLCQHLVGPCKEVHMWLERWIIRLVDRNTLVQLRKDPSKGRECGSVAEDVRPAQPQHAGFSFGELGDFDAEERRVGIGELGRRVEGGDEGVKGGLDDGGGVERRWRCRGRNDYVDRRVGELDLRGSSVRFEARSSGRRTKYSKSPASVAVRLNLPATTGYTRAISARAEPSLSRERGRGKTCAERIVPCCQSVMS